MSIDEVIQFCRSRLVVQQKHLSECGNNKLARNICQGAIVELQAILFYMGVEV